MGTVSSAIAVLAAVFLFSGNGVQPLNVKPGLWHVMGTQQLMGNPVKTDYKKCITEKDLNSNPWVNGPDENCTWTVVTSSGSDMEVKGTSCNLGKEYGMSTSVNLKLHAVDTENVKASMQGSSVGNGQTLTVNGTFTGKWMGSSCAGNKD